MDKKKTMWSSHLGLMAIIVAACLAVFVLGSAQAVAEDANKATMMMGKHDKMRECMANCTKDCKATMDDVAAAKMSIKTANEAIDRGDIATAKSELAKADMLMTKAHTCMKENVEKMPCMNSKCPTCGKSIDRMNVPVSNTAMYKGTKVGFCCPNCQPAWNKLTDSEKDAKVQESARY